MRHFFFIFFMFLFAVGTFSQQLSTKSKKAKLLYEKADNSFIISDKETFLKSAIKTDKSFVEAYWQLAQLYFKQKNDSLGIALLTEIVTNKNNQRLPETQLFLAERLYLSGFYEKAIEQTEAISDSQFIRQKTELLLQLNEAQQLKNQQVPYEPKLLLQLSTPFDDYFPSLTADEKIISTTVLVKSKPESIERGQEDIFWSRKKGDSYTFSQPLDKSINTLGNEGSQSFSADGRYMFFVACDRKENIGSCDIYYAVRQGDQWSLPINAGEPLNSEFWETNPQLSPSGDELFFVSSRPPSIGGKDIWHCKVQIMENGLLRFSQPENLGTPINTPKDEYAPFLHFDNKTLYYCSNGHGGLGRGDVFVSQRENGKFNTPKNLGYPINTHTHALGFVVNALGDKALFAAENLDSPYRDLDIYEVPLYTEAQPKQMATFSGKIEDAMSRKPLQASVEMFDQTSRTLSFNSVSDKKTGEFVAVLPNNTQHGLLIQKKGYLFASDTINAPHDAEKTFLLQPIMKGAKTSLKNIFFDFGSSQLQEKSFAEIENLYLFLVKNPLVSVKIVGHTDNLGNSSYNKKLSEERAKSVYNILINKGISSDRIAFEGCGAEQPIATNETEVGRSQNRRVEVEIM